MAIAKCKCIYLVTLGIMLSFTLKASIYLYYAAPTADMQKAFGMCCDAYLQPFTCNEDVLNFSYINLDAITVEKFRQIGAPRMIEVYNELTKPSSPLRKRLIELSELSDYRVPDVEIYLFDDRTGFMKGYCDQWYNRSYVSQEELGSSILWPSSYCEKTGRTEFTGRLAIGETASEKLIKDFVNGAEILNGLIIHHFVHTQFPPFVLSIDHSGTDIMKLPDCKIENELNSHNKGAFYSHISASMLEGIGAFYGMEFISGASDNFKYFLNSATPQFTGLVLSDFSEVDYKASSYEVFYDGEFPESDTIRKSPSEYYILSERDWQDIQDWLNFSGTEEVSKIQIRKYKWINTDGFSLLLIPEIIKGYLMLFNEYSYIDKHVSSSMIFTASQFLSAPKGSLRSIFVFCNYLAMSMESHARGDFENTTDGNVPPTSSLFAYALLDMLTHFSFTDEQFRLYVQNHLEPRIPIRIPISALAYFDHRDRIRELVCPYLGGNDCKAGTGEIDIQRAMLDLKKYCLDPSRIYK